MNKNEKSLIIVFTDLDGCLLDHHSYDYRPALPALDRLRELSIPVIPITSKTLEEVKALKFDFGSVPMITENGMVTNIPAEFFPSPHNKQQNLYCGQTYRDILKFLDQLPNTLRSFIQGFHDMSSMEVAELTGLDLRSAQRAQARQASEPFLWRGVDEGLQALKSLAESAGLSVTRGGRFFHLMSAGGKGKTMGRILKLFQRCFPDHKLITIALGDSQNDEEMLAAVDYGVIIPNQNGPGLDVRDPRGVILTAPEPGPLGWGKAILMLLDELQLQKKGPLSSASGNREQID